MAAPEAVGFSFACDRGGTFTDVVCRAPSGRLRVLKLLSEDPGSYADAPTEGIRRLLELETGESVPRGSPVPTARIASIRMGTTVATNALLERRGARTVLVVTRGFRNLLRIGTQARPRIFDLEIAMPPQLYSEVIEVDERLVLVQAGSEPLPQHAGAACWRCLQAGCGGGRWPGPCLLGWDPACCRTPGLLVPSGGGPPPRAAHPCSLPPSLPCQAFDELLLLKRGGETIFNGELGKGGSTLTSYFEAFSGVPKITKG